MYYQQSIYFFFLKGALMVLLSPILAVLCIIILMLFIFVFIVFLIPALYELKEVIKEQKQLYERRK